MSQEDEKDLKELVTQCLASKGFLSKIQAEIRAGVFVALEEEGIFKKNNLCFNKKFKDFIAKPDGLVAAFLVKEFIEFFNLEFTSSVFDPETQIGTDYKYDGRAKLAERLNIHDDADECLPLLCHLISKTKIDNGNQSADDMIELSETSIKEDSEKISLKSSPENSNHSPINNGNKEGSRTILDSSPSPVTDDSFSLSKYLPGMNLSPIGKLPPLGLKGASTSLTRMDMSQLNSLLNFEADGGENIEQHDEELALSSTSNDKNSDLDEVEEDLPPSQASG